MYLVEACPALPVSDVPEEDDAADPHAEATIQTPEAWL
jgi:hypothetical protein